MAENITVWSAGAACMQCTQTKRQFVKAGVDFTERDLEDAPEDLVQRMKDEGFTSAPVVITDAHGAWAGFNPGKIKEVVASQTDSASASPTTATPSIMQLSAASPAHVPRM